MIRQRREKRAIIRKRRRERMSQKQENKNENHIDVNLTDSRGYPTMSRDTYESPEHTCIR